MELLRVGALKTAQAAIWPDDAIVTNSKSDLWAFSRESDVQDWVSWSWWGCFGRTEVHLKLQHLADELEGLLILAKDIWSIISTAYLWKVEYYLFSCENFWLSRDVNPRQEGKRKKVKWVENWIGTAHCMVAACHQGLKQSLFRQSQDYQPNSKLISRMYI